MSGERKWTPGPYARHPGSRNTIRAPSGIVGHVQADSDEEQEANFRLFCAAPEMFEALTLLLSQAWDPDEDANERFERVAEEFRRDTGLLRPGKDAPAASGSSREEREAAWEVWTANRARKAIAKAQAALAKAEKGGA